MRYQLFMRASSRDRQRKLEYRQCKRKGWIGVMNITFFHSYSHSPIPKWDGLSGFSPKRKRMYKVNASVQDECR